MSNTSNEIVQVNIEGELRQAYLDYAMSVIVGRALPDVRDGLKPVHRRVLFAMDELSNYYNRPYVKSARVVGEVIGKYHPHGDSAVYDTIVRMAQEFSMRYLLVDGQGNFGSVDGDRAAAMRYTEIRMTRLSGDLLEDLDKETVNFVDNYDETLKIPEVLPTRIPNLLVNGSSGIAVGMATNIPPHNLREVISGCIAYIEDPEISIDGLMEHISGPDFPTAAIINGRAGIVSAYKTGRGKIYVRARAEVIVNEKNGREKIIVHELPYQLNKARLIEKIAELVKDKKIEGISELRDESDKDGLRIVIEMRRGESGEVVLNNLYSQTQLQNVFGINCVALVEGRPQLLNLKDMVGAFVHHRREVVTRRTSFLLNRAKRRGHILEGLMVALTNIDAVIELIKRSDTPARAQVDLMARGWGSDTLLKLLELTGADACKPENIGSEFGFRDSLYFLTEVQAKAILEMRLNRLTGLEKDKLASDYQSILDEIVDLLEILGSTDRLLSVVVDELKEIEERYGDDRRSEIIGSQLDLTVEDLINEEDMVVTISHAGYAKTQRLDDYQAQRRGGRGKAATSVRDEDFVEHLLIANTHDQLLCFSDTGKVYWLKVYQIPVGSRTAKGRPLINLLPLATGERITAILPVKEFSQAQFVFMATANGTVKKTPLEQFSRPRNSGLIALELNEGDTLVGVAITDGSCDALLVASSGKVARFKESNVRAMGRTARGVRGIKMRAEQKVIALIIPQENGYILTASEKGYGKRTRVAEFPVKGRGAQGVIGMQTSERNGNVVGVAQVFEGEEFMLISDLGTLVRTSVDEVSILARNTQGVRLIKVKPGEKLVGVERIVDTGNNNIEEGESSESSENPDVQSNDSDGGQD